MSDKMVFPWHMEPLDEWRIVGMNHYTGYNGDYCIYVAMMKGGRCIKAQGEDTDKIWRKLVLKAKDLT